MKKSFRILLVILLMQSLNSLAAPFDCKVDLNNVLVYSTGIVNVMHSGRGDYTVICNLKEEYQGVSVTTCAMWTSMLLTLKNNSKKAIFYYDNQYSSCANIPTYGSAPIPVYIGPAN
jgi:hypothetical protein